MKPTVVALFAFFGIFIYITPTHADDRLTFGVSAGTPFYLGGGTSVGTLETRNNEPPGGYEFGLDISYCAIKHGKWCLGPVAGVHYTYLRGQVARDADFTQGSMQTYSAQFGGRVSYAFDSLPALAQFDATLGPAYVDIHDLSSNGSDWVPEATLRFTVLYDNPDWPVRIGPYVRVSRMFGIDASGEPGKKDLRGDVTTGTIGIILQY